VTFALFTVAIAWPLQSALQKRIPVLLALVVTIVVTLAVLAILVFFGGLGIRTRFPVGH
jgi:AI-2 transport protein TqsA